MTLSAHRRLAIAARWSDWIPRVFIESRKMTSPKLFREHCYDLFHRRIVALISHDLPMRTIRHHELDSPFITEELFSDQLCKAVARRLPRLNRKPGIRRTREEIHSNVTN